MESPYHADSEAPLTITGDEAQVIERGRHTHERSPRARVGMWLAMRSIEPTLTTKEIAERLGISAGHLRTLIYEARKAGWLKFTDPLDHVEYGIIPKTVANLERFLDAQDKQVTIEVAKGTIFKQYQESKGISDAPQTVLALKIETGAPDPSIPIVEGRIVGKPRQIE